MELKKLGWNQFFEEDFCNYNQQEFSVGRISAVHTHIYSILTEEGEMLGEISGKMRFNALESNDYPAIGDWVVVTLRPDESRATIHGILKRKSKFSRKVPGINTEEQIIACNIDLVFLMTSLNSNFNLRRLERYLTTAWESSAKPVIILSKADLCDDVEDKLLQTEAIAFGTPVHIVSSFTGQGMNELKEYLCEGITIAVLGSSGVGKSTLINELCGETIQKVHEIRENDDKGRHTTTNREMIVLTSGAVIIDTPGMRELQLWEGSSGVLETFEDIEDAAKRCKFKNCRHINEPGCAVKEAIEEGIIARERLESYVKLQKELNFIESKQLRIRRAIEKKGSKSNAVRRNMGSFEADYEM